METIYFIIEQPYNNYVKIGKTNKHVIKRLSQLQTGNPNHLNVLFTIIRDKYMKISQFISVLEDMKKYYGDKYIWSMEDLDFPCPQEIEVELSNVLKRTDGGMMTGGKKHQIKSFNLHFEYEDGVDVLDRSFQDND